MNNFKRVLAVVLTLAMLLPMCIVSVSAATIGGWTTFAGKYLGGYYGSLKDRGFKFTETAEGGIFVDIATPTQYGTTIATRAAALPVTAVTSTEKVQLDGTTVSIELADTFTFGSIDSASISLLWTDKPVYTIDEAATMIKDETTGSSSPAYLIGHMNTTRTNGLRGMVPPDAKGIMVTVANSYGAYDADGQMASDVKIYYFDGEFMDVVDHVPGYRWTFCGRNHETTPNWDSSGIVQAAQRIDAGNGITFNVRADDTLGYIISINGIDYCLGKDVAYFPSNTGAIDDNEYKTQTGDYIGSMTEAKADIDLSGLTEILDGGYLTIGSAGQNNNSDANEYTITMVNGVPAAQWNGEVNTHTECTYGTEPIEVNWTACTDPSYETYKCTVCGNVKIVEVAAAGHDYDFVSETFADCENDGVYTEMCKVCDGINEKITRKLGHDWSTYTVTAEPTETATGLRTRSCATCNKVEEQVLPMLGSDYTEYWTVYGYNEFDQTTEWIEGADVIYPSVKEDGSLFLEDYAHYYDNCNVAYNVSVAMSKFAASINGFSATVTPHYMSTGKIVAENEILDPETGEVVGTEEITMIDGTVMYPETMSFIFTNEPEDYDSLGEYGVFSSADNNAKVYNMRYGFVYDHDYKGDEHTVVMTLMDYMNVGDGNTYGVAGDNVYDIIVYSIISEGNFWTSKYASNVNIPMGEVLNVSFVNDYSDGGLSMSAMFNGFKLNMPEALNSQLTTDEYYFGVGSFSNGVFLRGTSFEINTICGEPAASFDGYQAPPHVCVFETEVTKKPTCTVPGIETTKCACGQGTYTTEIPALNPTVGCTYDAGNVTKEPTCTAKGTIVYTCTVCESKKTETLPTKDHAWSNWVVTVEPTTESVGEETRTCETCGATETQDVPMLVGTDPYIVGSENYTITLKNITDIKEIRFAIGHYVSGTQIRNAEKSVTLDAGTVNKNVVDGTFVYDLPWVGEYTFWVRRNDGSQFFLYEFVTEINPYVTSYGVKLTVNDFGENYKDAWLAKGTFNTYNEIKASTAFKYQASATKLDNYAKTTHDFTYTMTDPGDYTVLIRYNDGSFDVIHHELTVTTPVLIENGLQAIITNIPDIRIIRTAYGHYTDAQSIKKASTIRYFNNKTAIKDAEEYMIQYRDEGEVTIIVEYNDGYKHFFYYNVTKKVPTMVQDGGTVTFGNLDDLYIIRYAPGKYTTAGNIKNAPGVQYKKADAINENGEIVLSGLTTGRWSFMVQYNDESYNFYLLDIVVD